MRYEKTTRLLNLLCGLLVFNGVLQASQETATQTSRLQIRLRPLVEVTNGNVRLTDIATFFQDNQQQTVNDLSEDLRRQLRRVEVLRLTTKRTQAMITRQSVGIRLQMLEAIANQVELIGSEVVMVSLADQKSQKPAGNLFRFASRSTIVDRAETRQSLPTTVLTDLSIERSISKELSSQFGIAPDGLQVRLLRSVVGNHSDKLKDIVDPVIQVTAPVKIPYGRQSLLVRILDGQRIALMQSVTLDVRVRQILLLARRPIATGTKLEASMLTEEVRFTDRQYDQLSMEDVVGMTAIRPLRSNEIVAWNNLRDPNSVPTALTKPIVNARDAVKVVASHKSLRIAVSSAQALESGRKNQLIRVRNIQSGKVFSARVIQPGQVQLIL